MNIFLNNRRKESILNEKSNNNIHTVITNNPEDTIYLGTKLGKFLYRGDLIAINGVLGAGKTCFIKGIAVGLESEEEATSPSFSIIKEYSAKIPIFHFDLYRLNSSAEIEELGYEEYFYGEGVTVIEWANKIKNYLPKELLSVNILMDCDNLFSRKINFEAKGERYKKLLEVLKHIENIRN